MELVWFKGLAFLLVFVCWDFLSPVSGAVKWKYNCLLPDEPEYGGFMFDDVTKSVTILCIDGYTVIGDARRQCVNFRWTGEPGDCVKAESIQRRYGCVLPKEPLYGTFKFDDTSKALELTCAPGYIMFGDAKRRCRNGRWTGSLGQCIDSLITSRMCPELKDPNNGRVVVEGRNEGDTAHFFCDEGFVLEGSPRSTCQPGRAWDGILPICISMRTAEDLADHLKANLIDSLAGSTADSETGAQSRLSPGKRGLDIVLLVDSSSSIGPNSLRSAKKFMKMLVRLFGVSPEPSGGHNGTRFALISFSDEATIVFNVDDPNARSQNAVNLKIDSLTNTGGGTNFKDALEKVSFGVYFMKIDGDPHRKADATRAVFIITDAQETSSIDIEQKHVIRSVANSLKTECNFEIFSIGIGNDIDKFMLAEIASKPELEHVFLINQFKDLEKIGDIIAEKNIDFGQCGISGKTEIAQGSQTAAKGAWPWLGWLTSIAKTDDNRTLVKTCGGSLLCDRWFMTAASCVSWISTNGTVVPNDPNKVDVYLSDHRLFSADDNEQHARVKNILIHENYSGEAIGNLGVSLNDVALLDLGDNNKTRPSLNKFLRPVCFPVNTTFAAAEAEWKSIEVVPESKVGYTTGWGHSPVSSKTAYEKYPFNELYQMERPVVKKDTCRKRYPDLDLDRFFCVGKETKESDTCVGDIGGPYVVLLSNKRFVSMGLALNTTRCEEAYQFSIFLKTLHPDVTEWVEPILNGCNRVEEIYK